MRPRLAGKGSPQHQPAWPRSGRSATWKRLHYGFSCVLVYTYIYIYIIICVYRSPTVQLLSIIVSIAALPETLGSGEIGRKRERDREREREREREGSRVERERERKR